MPCPERSPSCKCDRINWRNRMREVRKGFIREEVCSCHKYVLWEFHYKPRRELDCTIGSPEFDIGDESYFLELVESSDDVQFRLQNYSLPVDSNIRWWAGLKSIDGKFHHSIASGKLNLDGYSGLYWYLCRFAFDELERDDVAEDEHITFFFRVNTEQGCTGAEMCEHNAEEMTRPVEGSIREDSCYSYKLVFWTFDPERILNGSYVIRSPVFNHGNQSYFVESERFCDNICFNLYRMGPSVEGNVQWCAGLKLVDGSCYHIIQNGKLHLHEESELWTKTVNLSSFRPDVLKSDTVMKDGLVTYSFRMKKEREREETCPHSITVRGVGSIKTDEECSPYKQFVWDIDYQLRPEHIRSPIFLTENQSCFLELSCVDETVQLYLNRLGPSVDRSFRWWAGVKRWDQIYENYGCRTGLWGMKDESCEIWRRREFLFSFKERKRRMHLTVDFLVNLEPATCIHAGGQVLDYLKPLRNGDIVFRIQNKEFKIHKLVLCMRAPAFDGMFLHDTIENRTGVVDIVDIDPDIFQSFLNFVYTGNPLQLNLVNVFALYTVADKYLFEELKSLCLEYMKNHLSFATFFCTAKLAFYYHIDDLLKETIYFLSRNQNIIRTEAWLDFCEVEPDVANELLVKGKEISGLQ